MFIEDSLSGLVIQELFSGILFIYYQLNWEKTNKGWKHELIMRMLACHEKHIITRVF